MQEQPQKMTLAEKIGQLNAVPAASSLNPLNREDDLQRLDWILSVECSFAGYGSEISPGEAHATFHVAA